MKKVITSIVVLMSLNTIAMEKNKAYKGFELTKESEIINVSADQLWAMVGTGFEDAYLWATTVDHSVGNGTAQFEGASCDERSCDVSAKGFDKIVEKVTKYNDQEMNFAYDVTDGMPSFMHSAKNDWTVVSVGPNQSKLVMKADFRVKGLMGNIMKGMMKNKMEDLLEVVLNDAKVYAETGSPSSEKLARIEELAKKNKKAA